jgi:predicted HNH restriction endonuclease
LFSGVDYQELRDVIDTIQNTMNYVQVVRTSLIENDAARFADEFEREYDKLVRKLWDDEKKALIASDASTKEDIAKNQDQIQSLFSERRYEEVFSLIGSDALDQEALAKIAQNNVTNKREKKFIPLARPYNACANTEIRVAA